MYLCPLPFPHLSLLPPFPSPHSFFSFASPLILPYSSNKHTNKQGRITTSHCTRKQSPSRSVITTQRVHHTFRPHETPRSGLRSRPIGGRFPSPSVWLFSLVVLGWLLLVGFSFWLYLVIWPTFNCCFVWMFFLVNYLCCFILFVLLNLRSFLFCAEHVLCLFEFNLILSFNCLRPVLSACG